MPQGSTLRFDQVPIEDFLACLDAHERDARLGYLPRPSFLKEVRFESDWALPEPASPERLSLFLLQETDAVSQRSETFLIIHAPISAASPLKPLALRLRDRLEKRQIPALFRIDPKYGLIYGCASEPVEPFLKWDRPGVYATLYFTVDPSSPSLCFLEYVPAEQQVRYRELFQRYNHVLPVSTSFFQTTWQKLKGKGAVTPPPRRITYSLIRQLVGILTEETVRSLQISLIFKDLEPSDAKSVLLDGKYALYSASGNDRFFASLGELA